MIRSKSETGVKELRKKHQQKFYSFSLTYQKGDIVDKIMIHLKKLTGGTKSSILRNSLFSYYNFIISNLKELNQKDEKKRKEKTGEEKQG